MIIFADSDMGKAVATTLGQHDNAGQVCLAGTQLLIQRSVADQFLERMRAGVSNARSVPVRL